MSYSQDRHQELLSRMRGIYYVTDDRASFDDIHASVLAALQGGVRIIQLRHKNATSRTFVTAARKICTACDQVGALMIVNDRVDEARTIFAHGVHLGPDDLDPVDAYKITRGGMLIGISAGSLEEIGAYDDMSRVSYIGCGPVYGTKTKADAGGAIGVDALIEMKEAYPDKPLIAIGGITLENLPEVAKTGVAGAAVVTAISQASNPEQAARKLVACWNTYSPNKSL